MSIQLPLGFSVSQPTCIHRLTNYHCSRSYCYTPPRRLGALPKIRSAITSGDAAKDEKQEEQVSCRNAFLQASGVRLHPLRM